MKRTYRNRLMFALMSIVVFTTTYALILPAISIDRRTAAVAPGIDPSQARHLSCTYNVHRHNDSCYIDVPVLDAEGKNTGRKEKRLICDQVEYVVHEHNADCYENGNLVCPLPEIKAHVHDQKCYEKQQMLVCSLPEHTHTGLLSGRHCI